MTGLAFAGNSAAGSGAIGQIASFIPLIIIFLIGYFIYKKAKIKDLPPNPNPSGSHIGSGWKSDKIFIVIGVFGLLYAFTMDTSVATEAGHRVNNLGLMNDKQNYIIISGIFLFLGVILNISNRSKINKDPQASIVPDENDYKICLYCAEKIREQAKICRFCGKPESVKS